MSHAHPLVDVVIPVYNGASYLKEAIESVLSQTYAPLHLIIVDDGSQDSSGAIADEYVQRFPSRVQNIRQENKGLSAARNTGIRAAQGELIAFLDADDFWLPRKIEAQVAAWNNFSESTLPLGVVYCDYEFVDTSSAPHRLNSSRFHLIRGLRGDVFQSLMDANKVAGSGSGVLVKRDAFDRCGYFDERLNSCEDWDMWLRLAEAYAFEPVDEILVMIRRHSENMQNHEARMLRNQFAVLAKAAASEHAKKRGLEKELLHIIYLNARSAPILLLWLVWNPLSFDPVTGIFWKNLISIFGLKKTIKYALSLAARNLGWHFGVRELFYALGRK